MPNHLPGQTVGLQTFPDLLAVCCHLAVCHYPLTRFLAMVAGVHYNDWLGL